MADDISRKNGRRPPAAEAWHEVVLVSPCCRHHGCAQGAYLIPGRAFNCQSFRRAPTFILRHFAFYRDHSFVKLSSAEDYQQRDSNRRRGDYRSKSLAANFKESVLSRIALRAANAKMRLRPSANALSTRASLAPGGSQKNRSSASLVSEQRTSRPPIRIGNTTAVPSPARTISATLVVSTLHPCFIR